MGILSHPQALELPVAAIAETVGKSLEENPCLVVTAPPGAGKSTLLPLTLLEKTRGRILMLEPRRLAARQIALRMASLLGEKPGETVGYRIRFESKVGPLTRLEVLTEGILTRMLADDPALEGVSTVIFDEFHERSLQSDTALALLRESRQLLRPDLRLVVMSATIDTDTLCRELEAPLLKSEGRMYPVETQYLGDDANLVNTILTALREKDGDMLVFLPGEADIRRTAERLEGLTGSTRVYPLYGQLPQQEQQAAIAPSRPGERKVVLATSIAETSLTIEGVKIVIDSGLCRKPVYDPGTGLTHLETVRISLDMADQRRGRAGRVAPGVCYRLWSKATESRLKATRTPEILEADLSPAFLESAVWGEASPERLPWITPPPAQSLRSARELLKSLGALNRDGSLTPHGRRLAALPCHPRVSQMLLSAQTPEQKSLAATLAALLEEKDPLNTSESGIDLRLRALTPRIRSGAAQLRSLVRAQDLPLPADPYEAGALLARAYPGRIGHAGAKPGEFQLSGGGTAAMDPSDALAGAQWIVAPSLQLREGAPGRIFLAAPLAKEDLAELVTERRVLAWTKGELIARIERRVGAILLETKSFQPSEEEVLPLLADAAAREGLSLFNFSPEVENLQRRIAAVAQWHPELELPDVSTPAVLSKAADWLPLFAPGARSAQALKKLDMQLVIWSLLSFSQQQEVDRLAPTHIKVPTGSNIALEYRQGASSPVLRVRLQECFGLTDTPRVDGGARPVLMELLSPGYKPVQLTSDLRSFWSGTYFEVRKELCRRYPRHAWPDNPLEAPAIRGIPRK